MDKNSVVWILGGGIFNEGTAFWAEPEHMLSELGWNNFCFLKYALRSKGFSEYPPQGLGNLSLGTDTSDCRIRIAEIRQKFGPDKKYIFAGHSKSGLIGQVLAHEGLFDGLIALNPAMPQGFSALSFSSLWWMKSVLWQIIRKRSTRIAVNRSYDDSIRGGLHPEMDDEERRKTYQGLVWESGQVIWDLAFNKPEVQPELISEAGVPILMVSGDNDKLVKTSSVTSLANWHRDHGVEIKHYDFKGAAHYPFWGQERAILIDVMDQWATRNFCK